MTKTSEEKKEYNRQYNKIWYDLNREKRCMQLRTRMNETVKWYKDFKKNQKCARCGFSDYRALEFHHKNPLKDRDPKLRITNIVYRKGWSIKHLETYIEEEIDILCANCHRIVHCELEGEDLEVIS